MYKIGIAGGRDSILGFKVLGIQVFPVESSHQAEDTLKTMIKQGYSLIYITEAIMEGAAELIQSYRDEPLPIIIPIPDHVGSRGLGMSSLRETTIKAIGADILFAGEEDQ